MAAATGPHGRSLLFYMAPRRLVFLLWLVLAPSAAEGAAGVVTLDGVPVAADRIEIRLAPAAARLARRRPAVDAASGARARHERLGIAALDQVAARATGLTFERTFRGETAPEPGAEDLTAFYRVRLPAGLEVGAALALFRALPEVASAEAIPVLTGSDVPTDSLWSISTWFYQPSRADLHAPEAWQWTGGDSSTVIAILDTGVIPYHPDLQSQMWTNWAEAAGAPGVDDDGNGYVDDVSGWDFVDLVAGDQVTPGEDWDLEDNDPNDFAGHGTKVAGIAGAATFNTIGVAGTAWGARLMPLRVMWSSTASPVAGEVDMSFAAEALLYAARGGATVANCSFATASLASLTAAANEATRRGMVIVCAAGNSNPFHFLADREDVIAVGAVDGADQVTGFSNVGPFVDFCAPGVAIHSTFVRHAGADSVAQRQPHYDGGANGTSFSAPFAAGAVALVQARRRSLALPPLPPVDMLFRLRETADDITAANPGGADYGTGRLNLHRAVSEPWEWTSSVFRTGSRTVGPAVVVPTVSGAARVVFSTNNSRLVIVSAVARDTIANLALPSRLSRQLAAADLGLGQGSAVFGGTIGGQVTGHRLDGSGLPGWPVSGAAGFAMSGGPALGDLDSDGAVEIVCGADDGALHVWGADGTPRAGFPLTPFASGYSGAIALADVDGIPGSEIVCLSKSADLTVIRGNGATLAGFPINTGFISTTISPVVVDFTLGGEPAIVVPIAGGVRAYRPSGAVRFSASALGGNLAQDPAIVSLTDPANQLALTLSNQTITVLDSAGVPPVGWPEALGGASQGPPVTVGFGGGSMLLAFRAGALTAWNAAGQRLPLFPRPGVAGTHPTVADLDGDGRAEMAAGTGPDSLFYLYDLGAGSLAGDWPTPRGNSARTGARAHPNLGVFDDVPPAAIADLATESVDTTSIGITWTATGNDGSAGRASGCELQVATIRAEAGTFASGVLDLPAPDSSGTPQSFQLTGLTPGTTYFLAIRARDEQGNRGASSDVLGVTTPLGAGPPMAEASGAIHPRARPSVAPVELLWTGARGSVGSPHVIRIFDLSGRMVRAIPVGAAASGTATWDGRGDHGERFRAGLYFARLESAGARATTRIVLVP